MKKFRKSSGVILKHKDEVLLCKRSPKKSMPNVWSIPSGGIEEGETPGQAAIREYYEETNIELNTKLDLVGLIDKFNKGGLKSGIVFVFLQNTKEKQEPDLDKASDGHEHTECRYFKLEDIPKQKGNDQLYDILEKILD
jgi:mutator protein MutT